MDRVNRRGIGVSCQIHSILYSQENVIISGGSILVARSPAVGASLRAQSSQPSRHSPSSPDPRQRAMSSGRKGRAFRCSGVQGIISVPLKKPVARGYPDQSVSIGAGSIYARSRIAIAMGETGTQHLLRAKTSPLWHTFLPMWAPGLGVTLIHAPSLLHRSR